MKIFAFIIFIVLILLDLPNLRKEQSKKELAVYCALSTIALVYIMTYTFGGKVFSPAASFFDFLSSIGLDYSLWQGKA